MIRRAGMDIHAWSFNTNEQYLAYTGPWSDPKGEGGADKNYLDMSFTNLTDLCIRYYNDTMQNTRTQVRTISVTRPVTDMPVKVQRPHSKCLMS